VVRHIFQACPVWIYTQSNITQASYSPEYITPTQQMTCLYVIKLPLSYILCQLCPRCLDDMNVWISDKNFVKSGIQNEMG
jgi:hypothetical protein